ncbi:MAG TPA: TRAP transporter large permease [Clostridia bacterium]|nr:TRAP transporter large permease [Clostridia bacterium]
MQLVILGVVLLLTLMIGVPLVFCLGFTSLVYILVFANVPLSIIVQRVFAGSNSFTMMSAPLFMLAALLMDRAGISDSIMKLSEAIVGRIKGGLSAVNIVFSMIFAGISGTAQADTACVGGMMIPAMLDKGYDKEYAAAVTAASSTIGIIIPPSTPMIYYGVLTGLSISSLFIAGVVPGILIGIGMLIVSTVISARRNYESNTQRYTVKERLLAVAQAWPPLGMIVIIIGGILGGVFTPTEAAAVAALYALFVGLFITKKLKTRDLPSVLKDAAAMTGSVMIIIAVSDLLGWVITNARIPQTLILPLIQNFQGGQAMFLWIVSIILIIAGVFLHGTAMLVVIVPLFLPAVGALGINALQFAMVVIMCWGIGQQTPPVGSALYICCQMADVDMYEIAKANLPFLAVLMGILALIIHVPAVVTWLPALLG